jgi:hypothetical protein
VKVEISGVCLSVCRLYSAQEKSHVARVRTS